MVTLAYYSRYMKIFVKFLIDMKRMNLVDILFDYVQYATRSGLNSVLTRVYYLWNLHIGELV